MPLLWEDANDFQIVSSWHSFKDPSEDVNLFQVMILE